MHEFQHRDYGFIPDNVARGYPKRFTDYEPHLDMNFNINRLQIFEPKMPKIKLFEDTNLEHNAFSKWFYEVVDDNAMIFAEKENYLLYLDVFSSLVEFEALQCLKRREPFLANSFLEWCKTGMPEYRCTGIIDNTSSLIWKHGEEIREGFIDLVRLNLKISRQQAVTTTGSMLNMYLENLYTYSYNYNQIEPGKLYNNIYYCLPETLKMRNGAVANLQGVYRNSAITDENSKNGIAVYKINDKNHKRTFCIPVSNIEGIYRAGFEKQKAMLFNQCVFDEPKTSNDVIIFRDIRACIELNNVIEMFRSKGYESSNQMLISGVISDSIDKINWNYCFGKNVYIVLSPNAESYKEMLEYVKWAEDKCFAGLNFVPFHIFFSEINKEHYDKLTSSEKQLIDNAFYIDSVNNNSDLYNFFETIKSKSLNYYDFYQLCIENGVIKPKKNGKDIKNRCKELKINKLEFENIEDDFLDGETISLDRIITKDYTTLISGEQDSGKGFFAIALMICLASGTKILGFESKIERKVLYLNYEESTSRTTRKIKQICNAYNIDLKKVSNNILVYTRDNSFIDLMDEHARKIIEKTIEARHIDVIIVDNLMRCSAVTVTTQKQFKNMNGWFSNLERDYKIAVIYCHHTNKSHKIDGSYSVEASQQNIFDLTKVNIKNKRAKVDEQQESMFKEIDGCLFELVISKCKEYSNKSNNEIIVYLSSKGGKFQIARELGWTEDSDCFRWFSNEYCDSQSGINDENIVKDKYFEDCIDINRNEEISKIDIDKSCNIADNGTLVCIEDSGIYNKDFDKLFQENLSSKVRSLLELIDKSPKKLFKNNDIQNMINVKCTQANEYLNELVNYGYLEKKGKKKGTIYKRTEKQL